VNRVRGAFSIRQWYQRECQPFFNDVRAAMSEAQLVISRAGRVSVAIL